MTALIHIFYSYVTHSNILAMIYVNAMLSCLNKPYFPSFNVTNQCKSSISKIYCTVLQLNRVVEAHYVHAVLTHMKTLWLLPPITVLVCTFNLFLLFLWNELHALLIRWLRTTEVLPSGILSLRGSSLPSGILSRVAWVTQNLCKKLVICKCEQPATENCEPHSSHFLTQLTLMFSQFVINLMRITGEDEACFQG